MSRRYHSMRVGASLGRIGDHQFTKGRGKRRVGLETAARCDHVTDEPGP
jgi:hypothetical protein